MASVNKIELCGPLESKAAFSTLECEAISLPHGVRDVLFVSDCFTNADVKARLEHSPDGSAGSWSTVQWKRIVSGEASGSTWGNEKYLDTTPKRPYPASTPDYKNKHIKLNVTFDNNTTDIIQHKLDATSPFNLSMWMKSGEVPSTYNPPYTSTKSLKINGIQWQTAFLSLISYDYFDSGVSHWGTNFSGPRLTGAGYSFSFWYKRNGTTTVAAARDRSFWTMSDGWARQWIWNFLNTSNVLQLKYEVYNGHQYTIEWDVAPATNDFLDGNWHHVLFHYTGATDWSAREAASAGTGVQAIQVYLDNVLLPQDNVVTTGAPDATNAAHGGVSQVNFATSQCSNGTGAIGYENSHDCYLDEVTWWNIGLNEDQRLELYNEKAIIDISTLSFFNTSNCGLWLKMGENPQDIIANSVDAAFLAGTNSIMDNSGNGNHMKPNIHHTSSLGNITIDTGSYAPPAVVTTNDYSPILFRSGGKIEANTFENLKGFTYPTDINYFGFNFTGTTTEMGPWGGMGTYGGTYDGFPDLDEANSFAGWIFLPTGWGAANKTFFLYGAGNGTAQNKTYITPSSSTVLKFYIDLNTPSGNTKIQCLTVPYTENAWHHFVVTKAASSSDAELTDWKLYVNKVSQTLSDSAGILPFNFNTQYVGTYSRMLALHYGQTAIKIDDWSFWGKKLEQADVTDLYDNPSDLRGSTDLKGYYRFGDGDSVGDGSGTFDSVTAAGVPTIYDMSGSADGYNITEQYFYLNGAAGATTLTDLVSSDPTYSAATSETFGEGMTISLTDKVKTDGTWSAAGNEDPHLLISFNGFENDAEQWIAYKCDQGAEVQRNISYDGTGTPTAEPVNLLDNTWHNLIINYKGVASGATAYLGPDPTGVAGHTQDGYEFHVAMDGQLTDHINKVNNVPRGFNAAKTVNNDGIATLDIEDKHLKNVSDTYVPTTFFASGIHEVGADSKYAYQGYIDETSFHSDSWWKKTTGNMDQMCNCPLEAVWGDNAQRLTGGQGGSNVAYGFTPMDNTPSVPHNLIDPQSIMTKPGDWAYIEPFPSGMYRCNENLPGHTSKEACTEDTTEGRKAHSNYEEGVNEAIDHWTASGGGLEVYYRWGDVPTDCKSCVNEARGYISRISDDEDYTNLEDNLKRSANIEGSLDWRDLKLGITTTEKIYVEGDSGNTGGAVEYLDAINNCSADGDHVITHLNVPHLHYVRVVYTGEGACAAGQCIASLFYRKEK